MQKYMVCVFFVVLCLLLRAESMIKEGDACFGSDNMPGTCISLTNCDSALDAIEKQKSPVFCVPGSEINFNALVCCQHYTNNNNNIKELISLTMCKKYYPELYEKGFVQIAVVGGKKSLAKEFPHMALVGYGEQDDITWYCGGSLISEKFVLTAAHCIWTQMGNPEWVRLGELDTSTDTDDASPQDFAVVRSIIHPNYQTTSHYDDIGLLELDKAVTFTRYIKPACLHSLPELSDQYAIASGWGRTSFAGSSSSHLLKVDLIFVNHTTCNQYYMKFRSRLSMGISDTMQICAGGNDGKDTCQGDSGGPLQIKKPESKRNYNVYDIVGISSFGLACGLGDVPAVYTRVSFYLDWIEQNVWP